MPIAAQAADWLTFAHDPQRTGWAAEEPAFSVKTVPSLTLLWKTKVVKINRFPYHRKKEILDRYPECATSQYFKEGRDTGYFIFYRVSVTEMLDTDALLDFGSRRSAGSASTMKQLKTGSVARKTRIRRR